MRGGKARPGQTSPLHCTAPTNAPKQTNKQTHETEDHSLHAQVPRTKHIHPLESKTRKHLHTPPPQPPHRNQLAYQILIGGAHQPFSCDLARGEFLRQPGNVLCFALREACGAQRGDVFGEDLRGRGERGVGFREERGEFGSDGGGCRAGDL